jgi:CubicO group peptidase (beta-lactamase class C family)
MDEFLDGIYRSRPLFTPGEGWQYSNCGFAVLARAVELAEGKRFGEVLAERILSPLGMDESALGFEGSWDERVAEIELPKGLEKERAFLNTRYWRALGAPWGALVSNTENLARFGEAFRNGGELDEKRILASATVEAMTQDQLHVQPRFPTRAHPGPHGLAWRIRGKAEGGFFGDLTAPDSYGHTGATGTFLWVDPTHELTAVFLSNKEGGNDEARFARLSNAIVAACT